MSIIIPFLARFGLEFKQGNDRRTRLDLMHQEILDLSSQFLFTQHLKFKSGRLLFDQKSAVNQSSQRATEQRPNPINDVIAPVSAGK